MSTAQDRPTALAKLRGHLAKGVAKIKAIRARNARRRKAIKRLEAESGALIMFDSIEPSQMPKSAPAVAGYTGGRWPTFRELRVRFPHAYRLPIAVSASEDAECLDVENGDASNAAAVVWVARQLVRGVKRPVLYTSASNVDLLREMLGGSAKRVRIWSAHYTFAAHICGPHSCGETAEPVDGTQWTDQALGRNLDQSLLHRDFFG